MTTKAQQNEEQAANELTARVIAKLGATSSRDVQCPREQSRTTPCVARDGKLAVADDGVCVGCGAPPSALLETLNERNVPVPNSDLAALQDGLTSITAEIVRVREELETQTLSTIYAMTADEDLRHNSRAEISGLQAEIMATIGTLIDIYTASAITDAPDSALDL